MLHGADESGDVYATGAGTTWHVSLPDSEATEVRGLGDRSIISVLPRGVLGLSDGSYARLDGNRVRPTSDVVLALSPEGLEVYATPEGGVALRGGSGYDRVLLADGADVLATGVAAEGVAWEDASTFVVRLPGRAVKALDREGPLWVRCDSEAGCELAGAR
jgi:hypothetical protein